MTARRSLVEGMGQPVHAAAKGVEAGARSTAEALDRQLWQTASKREGTSTLLTETVSPPPKTPVVPDRSRRQELRPYPPPVASSEEVDAVEEIQEQVDHRAGPFG